jgi:hypothetical protein
MPFSYCLSDLARVRWSANIVGNLVRQVVNLPYKRLGYSAKGQKFFL